MEAYGFDWRTMTESECVVELFKLYQKLVEVETAKTAGEMPASPGGATKHTCKKKMKEKEKSQTHKKHPQTSKKPSQSRRPKPHHLMKCEKGAWRSHVPFSHFGGGGGDWSPHKKKLGRRYRIEIMIK